jgi:hypothetical protein
VNQCEEVRSAFKLKISTNETNKMKFRGKKHYSFNTHPMELFSSKKSSQNEDLNIECMNSRRKMEK